MRTSRRNILKAALSSAMLAPFAGLFAKSAEAAPMGANRLIVFYFPDGVCAPGDADDFHATGSGANVILPPALQPLAPWVSSCAFLRGLSMGPTDAGSHPGGAKKLLTATDGGNGQSIDRRLADSIGASYPFRSLYLGAMATQNNASGDKFISYPSAGTTVAPQDNPLQAFSTLFGGGTMPAPSGGGAQSADPTQLSVIDAAIADINDLKSRLGDVEKSKLDLHLQAMKDLENRLNGMGGMAPLASCNQSLASLSEVDPSRLSVDEDFPKILRAQIDVMVQAMACGLTKIGVVQASQHTSELIMSRFQGTPMYTPNFDMRSHQASHYGQSSSTLFTSYTQQVTWFVSQFAYLLDQLSQRPEGAGTMLDNSIVLLCSEISDGNTHSHDDMPFIIGGKAGGALRTGQIFDFNGRRHADLLLSIAHAMGDSMTSFGDSSSGLLPNLVV
jgi:hypothetical protein